MQFLVFPSPPWAFDPFPPPSPSPVEGEGKDRQARILKRCACIGIEVAVFLGHYWHCGMAQEEREDEPGKPTKRNSKLQQ
jgi:hypothetical protein